MTHVPEIDTDSAVEGLFVVETSDGDAFLGELSFEDDTVVIHNGFVGRPPVVPRQDVRSIIPAEEQMANTSGQCAHPGCKCTVQTGQTYCSDYCQQQAQQAQGGQQRQQGAASGSGGCGCGHPACQVST